MSVITAEKIKEFLVKKFDIVLRDQGMKLESVTEDFDFFAEGIVDSVGVLNLISDVEKAFNIELDMEQMDAEQLTIVGPFCRYAAEHCRSLETATNGNSSNGLSLNPESILSEVREFIRKNYSIASDDRDFTDDVHLYDSGYVDPMAIGALKNFIESKYAIQLAPSDLSSESMNTVRGLSQIVAMRRNGEI